MGEKIENAAKWAKKQTSQNEPKWGKMGQKIREGAKSQNTRKFIAKLKISKLKNPTPKQKSPLIAA